MKLDRKFSKTDTLDYIGNRDQLGVIWNRVKHERKGGDYSLRKATVDAIEHGKSLQGSGTFIGTLAAAAGLTLSAPAPAAAAAFLTALGKAAALAGSAVGACKMGNSMVRAWLPNHHDKLKSKF